MKIHQAMINIMRECSAIGKDSKNTQQNFSFRGVDAVMNALHPLFAKHGVYIVPEVMEEKSEERQTKNGGNLIYRIVKVKWTFTAEDGSAISAVNVGEGMDSGDKAMNKAMAVALKYVLTQGFILPYDEVDPDSESHDVKPRKTESKSTQKKESTKNPEPSNEQENKDENPNLTEEGIVQHVSSKSGEQNGKSWTRFGIKMNDHWYNTFDKTFGEFASMAKESQEKIYIDYTMETVGDKECRNIVNIGVLHG